MFAAVCIRDKPPEPISKVPQNTRNTRLFHVNRAVEATGRLRKSTRNVNDNKTAHFGDNNTHTPVEREREREKEKKQRG